MSASPLFPLFLTIFVDVLGFTLVIPLLPYYAQHFGATPLEVGLLNGCYAAAQLFSGPILGGLSDRLGRKRVLMASQLGTLVGFSVLGMASSLWMLFLGRLIAGATAGNLTIAQAYISDVTAPEKRTKAFGIIGIAFGMGFLFGPPLSGLLANRMGFSAPPLAAAALSALSATLTLTLLPDLRRPAAEGAPPGQAAPRRSLSFGRFLSEPAARTRLLQFFFFICSFSSLIGGVPLYLERRFGYNVEQTGYVFAFSGLVGAIIQGGMLGRLASAFGEERLALLGFIAMLSHGVLGWVHSLPGLLAVIAIGGFGNSVVRPSLTTLITRSVPPDQQGAAIGVSQSMASIGQILGAVLAGALINQKRLDLFGMASATFAAIGVALFAFGKSAPLTEEQAR